MANAKKTFNIKLAQSVIDELKRLAKREDRSASALARRYIMASIERERSGEKRA